MTSDDNHQMEAHKGILSTTSTVTKEMTEQLEKIKNDKILELEKYRNEIQELKKNWKKETKK